MNIEKELKNIYSKKTSDSCKAFDKIIEESKISNKVYPYWNNFLDMLNSKNAYIRMRGLSLIAINSKWDIENHLENTILIYLERLKDSKPIVLRICIQRLEYIIEYHPEFIPIIKKSLIENMDLENYKENMVDIISKDRENILNIIDGKI